MILGLTSKRKDGAVPIAGVSSAGTTIRVLSAIQHFLSSLNDRLSAWTHTVILKRGDKWRRNGRGKEGESSGFKLYSMFSIIRKTSYEAGRESDCLV